MSDIKRFEPLWGVWRTEALIGEGSFGRVYRAVREEFGRKYYAAIKHISIPANESQIKSAYDEGLADSAESAREYFEAITGSLLSEIALMTEVKGCTNIVSYEDHMVIPKSGGVGYDVFIRMELLTGLSDAMRIRPFSQADIVRMGMDICSALEVCAEKGIIHRDIKTSNIFVNDRGDFKLGDFGVARHLEQTTAGISKKGTFAYMAPEVYRGETTGLTADIYSLGIVMYRLLNDNRAPFLPVGSAKISPGEAETALARRMAGAALPPPVNAGAALAKVVLRAAQFDRRERYQSPTELKRALAEALTGGAEERTPPALPFGARRPATAQFSPTPGADCPTVMQDSENYTMAPDGEVRAPRFDARAPEGHMQATVATREVRTIGREPEYDIRKPVGDTMEATVAAVADDKAKRKAKLKLVLGWIMRILGQCGIAFGLAFPLYGLIDDISYFWDIAITGLVFIVPSIPMCVFGLRTTRKAAAKSFINIRQTVYLLASRAYDTALIVFSSIILSRLMVSWNIGHPSNIFAEVALVLLIGVRLAFGVFVKKANAERLEPSEVRQPRTVAWILACVTIFLSAALCVAQASGLAYRLVDGGIAITGYYSQNEYLRLPENTVAIDNCAFEFNENIKELSIPGSVSSIGDWAFHYSPSLKSINIPASVTTIGDGAFSNCDNLTICAPRGSYAITYAQENGIAYSYTD